ncbi:class I SAM-dependent methyltransferase [Cellulosimicrobium sp. ES-005]|uniref:Class I SAM-dependent methyltransferase n=1 Tax=Cellulosimicrobium sp. ES-005 TaxID=3163031 RepID=A0AAU8G286_9MICO
MVTLSPSPEHMPHQQRRIAESFGTDATRYDRTRPHYPRALADAVLDGLDGRRVLDVGIGTGLSALPFRAAGADVVGIEVDERMAEVARSKGFVVETARFEEWDPAGRTFDAVIAGQTWHWVDPDTGARQAARVVRPGGRIALFWNAAEPEPAVASAFARVYRDVDTGLPFTPFATSATTGQDRFLEPAEAGLLRTGDFAPPERLQLAWTATITRQAWLDQVPTNGGHHLIPADQLTLLLNGLGAVVDAHGGTFTMRYTTHATVARRL